jgi:hypothetical protein
MDNIKIAKVQAVSGREKIDNDLECTDEKKGYMEWVGLLKSKDGQKVGSITGELSCEVRSRFVSVPVQVGGGEVAQKDDVSVKSTGNHAMQEPGPNPRHVFSFKVTWKTGVSGEELTRLGRDLESTLRGKKLDEKEQEWFTKAIARYRHLRTIQVQADDKDGENIASLAFAVDDTKVGEILVDVIGEKEHLQAGTVRFLFADAKNATVPFEIRH